MNYCKICGIHHNGDCPEKTSYTKGEWIIHEWGDKFQVVEAQVRVKEEPGITMTGQQIIAKEVTKANAQLIVSAPKLHQFVEEMAEQSVPGAQALLDEIKAES